MKLWHKLKRSSKKQQQELKSERLLLLQEIDRAHSEWVTAQHRLDYVLEKEQIDYAVYAMEAAEKRFEMLIKQAKQMELSAIDISKRRALEG